MRYYLRELGFAFRHAATLRDAIALSLRTVQFHAGSKAPRPNDPAHIYRLRFGTVEFDIHLRTRAGDLFVFYEVFVGAVYDTAELVLPPSPNIIDLGANVGIASLYFATQHAGAALLAVEPDPENLRVLRSNVASLCGRARILAAAVAGTTGSRAFAAHGPAWGRSLAPGDATVDAMTISDIIAASGFERVHLLKIDVEGAEAEIFAGPLNWLKDVDNILIELHGRPSLEEFTELMQRAGWRVFHTRSGTVAATRA